MFPSDMPHLPGHAKNGRHNHYVHFYNDDSALLDEVSRYIGGALGTGDSAVVIATPTHREGIRKRLHQCGFDFMYPTLKRRYLEFDAAGTLSQFMVDGLPDAASFSGIMSNALVKARVAAQGQPPRVAAFGEMVALLWAQGNEDAALALERLWNDLAHSNSFDLYCAYPKSAFALGDEEPFLKICREHSQVTFAGGEISLDSELTQ
jgi:hypothetical protein